MNCVREVKDAEWREKEKYQVESLSLLGAETESIGSLKKVSSGDNMDNVHGYCLDNQKFHIPLA
jgi:hypothetical protein